MILKRQMLTMIITKLLTSSPSIHQKKVRVFEKYVLLKIRTFRNRVIPYISKCHTGGGWGGWGRLVAAVAAMASS